jgi:antitoxin component of MazEF toxin-antitoxin module
LVPHPSYVVVYLLVEESIQIVTVLAPADGGLLLKKALRKGKRYALADILDSFPSSSAHPEEDFGKPQGEEVW